MTSDGYTFERFVAVPPKVTLTMTIPARLKGTKNPIEVNASKKKCNHGHPLSGKNLYVKDVPRGTGDNRRRKKKRLCKTCLREAQRRYRAKRTTQ